MKKVVDMISSLRLGILDVIWHLVVIICISLVLLSTG